jgi:hypothetical protein
MCSHRFFSLVEIEIRFHWMDDFDENEVRFHWMDEQFAFSLLFVGDDGVTVTPDTDTPVLAAIHVEKIAN